MLLRLLSSGITWLEQNSDRFTSSLVLVMPCLAVFALVAREVTKYIAASLGFQLDGLAL